MFKEASLSVNKESVALVVVMLDVIIAAFFYGSFVYLKFLEKITIQEISALEVTASDFSVHIKNLPPHKNLKDLKIKLWAYVDEVFRKFDEERKVQFINYRTG